MTAQLDSSAEPGIDAIRAAKLVEGVVGIAWATDHAGRFVYVTPTAPAFRQLSLDQLNSSAEASAGWSSVVHPDDYKTAEVAWKLALQSGIPYAMDHRMQGANGVPVWVRVTGQAIRGTGGQITGWYGSVIGSAPSSVSNVSDRHLPDMDKVHPHDRSALVQASARAFFHGVPQISSYRELQPDGCYRWNELRVDTEHSASVDPGIAIAMQNDAWTVAESLGETVEAVRAAQLLENLYGGAWALDARGRFTYATPTSQTSIGLTLEDLNQPLGERDFFDGGEHGWKRTVHPEDYDRMATGFRTGLVRGEAWNVEYRVLRANGDYVWHRVGARPTHDEHGRVTGWYGISLDIDVYKKTETALRESEQRLQQLIDAVPAQIWSLTPEGQPCYVNNQLTKLVGVSLEDLVGPDGSRTHADIHPDHRHQVETAIARALKTGEPFEMRYRQQRVDGTYRWVEGRATPLRGEDGQIVQWYGVCFDVDNEVRANEELRLTQERLARASQAASLAELSASIAHEVNQPLAATIANAHACHRWLEADPPRLDRAKITVERIIRDANAAADIVSRTRDLFKQAVPAHSEAHIEPAVTEATRILADLVATLGVTVTVDFEPRLASVRSDRLQLQQILVNLMRNGIEAMAAEQAGKELGVRSYRIDDHVHTEVVDQGTGLADPDRIFDPFYTTKEAGLGMGLAITRSIIASQGGRLWAESNPGGGTKFAFTLPLFVQ